MLTSVCPPTFISLISLAPTVAVPHKNQHPQKLTREMTETILNISAMLRFCETRCTAVIYDHSKALQIVFRNSCLSNLLLLVNDMAEVPDETDNTPMYL